HLRFLAALVPEDQGPALPPRALRHLEEPQRSHDQSRGIVGARLGAEARQELRRRVVQSDIDGLTQSRYSFTAPRAKSAETKLTSAVASTSQSAWLRIMRFLATSFFSWFSRSTTADTSVVSLIESFWSSKSFSSSALCSRSFVR